jgi:phenol hydroxylase P1 protein
MKLDIQTTTIEPKRQTYGHLARRFGADRPASRYEEATFDIQPTVNFHYRPLWAPERELYDPSRTQIVLDDFYALTDPRQLYYGSYNISRAGMEAASRKAFELVEERSLLETLDERWSELAVDTIVAFRHYEWGANMNNWKVADDAYGAAMASAASFCAADRLGMAQVLSRIGLTLDGQTGDALTAGKSAWLEAPHWQPTRRALEDLFVVEDWFETFLAQDLVLDGLLHPLVFDEIDASAARAGGAGLSMLDELLRAWFADCSKWVDHVVKTAAEAKEDNRRVLSGWYRDWRTRALEAAAALAQHALGAEGDAALARVTAKLSARAGKLGLEEATS